MQMTSSLSAKEYLSTMMSRMDSVTHFGHERFTGMRMGKFFYVIHHSEHQYDRKFNSPKTAALGYVKDVSDGCEVHFMKFKGLLCPSQFLLYLVLSFLFALVTCGIQGSSSFSEFLMILAIFLPIYFLIVGIATLFESMSDRSLESEDALLSLLDDPTSPFTYC